MPAKGKRIAARQAQLNRRRRRQARAADEGGVQAEVQAAGPASATVTAPAAVASAAPTTGAAAPQGNTQPASVSVRPPTPSAGQGRNAQPLAYTHLAGELRRILILAGIVTAVLIGVSFVV